MSDERSKQLIRRITGIGFNIDTDTPSEIQVESARDGVMYISEYEFDDDGYISKPPREHEGSFDDALQCAIDCLVSELTINGLSRDEAIELLLSPDYRAKTFELLENGDIFGGVAINGIRFFLEGGQLVNEDFGPWPFQDGLA